MSDRPKLPENPPFAKGPYWVNGAMWICGVDAYGGTCHIADMRGWGYLTGHGMALALSNDDAFNAQKDTANWIVAAMNAYAQPAPVTVQEVLSNPLKDRGKMIKPFPGAPAGGYPLTPSPAESAEATPVTVEEAARELVEEVGFFLRAFDVGKPYHADPMRDALGRALRTLAGEKP
jgi:hypothetical protein